MIYKIPLQGYILLSSILFFLNTPGNAQELTISPYGTAVMDKISVYKRSVTLDSTKKMAELKSVVKGIVYDLRYATANNFMHRKMYPSNTRHTFMRLQAAYALAAVQQDLNKRGLGLKIFDAYRPYAVTVRFWELVKDERYVANPAKGSGHNRGLAVDLTIIDLATGAALDMGTGFDNFTDTAHHTFTQLPESVLQNRKLLKETMQKHGFSLLETEWWHYFWPNDRNYEVLDIPFNKLQK
jgi:zinc D-Ala-D-Ala dipeptidase